MKNKRIPYEDRKEDFKNYLKVLKNNIKLKRGKVSTTNLVIKHNMPLNINSVLQKQGVIEKKGEKRYFWTYQGEVDVKLAETVIQGVKQDIYEKGARTRVKRVKEGRNKFIIENKDILEEVFQTMPETFSTHLFASKVREKGVDYLGAEPIYSLYFDLLRKDVVKVSAQTYKKKGLKTDKITRSPIIHKKEPENKTEFSLFWGLFKITKHN